MSDLLNGLWNVYRGDCDSSLSTEKVRARLQALTDRSETEAKRIRELEKAIAMHLRQDDAIEAWNTRPIEDELKETIRKLRAENDRRTNLLEDVINELDLSGNAMETHGPLGTEPAEMVRLVLEEKDFKIRALSTGLINLNKRGVE